MDNSVLLKELISNPNSWYEKSIDLYRFTYKLRYEIQNIWLEVGNGDHTRLQPKYFYITYMLLAFCLENLLKGLIAEKRNWQTTPFVGKFPTELDSHDLRTLMNNYDSGLYPNLINECKYEFLDEFIDTLSSCSIWMGRYNLPKTDKELSYIKTISGKEINIGEHGSNDMIYFNVIYGYLASLSKSELFKGISS
jgi:hypothetical protein